MIRCPALHDPDNRHTQCFLDPGYITTTCTDCAVCGIEYRDVDDFIARDPRASGSTPWTPDPDTGFTDELCWEADE